MDVCIFSRQIPADHRSIIIVLFTINIELINATTAAICCSIIFVIAAFPLSFILAQMVVWTALSLGCLMCELAVAISLSKILLVTHFSAIFRHDPEKLGLYVFIMAAALAFVPTLGICAYQTYQGQLVSKGLAYLTKYLTTNIGFPYLMFYIIFWTALSIIMLLISLLYIPYYIRKNLNSNSIQVAEAGHERKQVSIKRILFGFVGSAVPIAAAVIVEMHSISTRFPPQIYGAVINVNLMLTYFILEKEVLFFIKRKVLARIPVIKSLVRGDTVSPLV